MVRRLLAVACALGLFTACSDEPRFRLSNPSCGFDYPSYGGDLTWALMSSDGTGPFDFDPPGRVEARRFGEYVLESGVFVYTVEYDQAHYRQDTRVDGFGYAATNGDLDIEARHVTTDVNGDTWGEDVRIERTGCDQTTSRIRRGYLSVTEGTYGAEGFAYTRRADVGYEEDVVADGVLRPDHTWEESFSVEEGTYAYSGDSEGDADGNETTDWVQSDRTWEAVGTTETEIDGTTHESYDYESTDGDYSWDVTIDYDGNGGGTYTVGNTDCDVTYDEWTCTYDCGGGERGSCG